jgi:hypothetical protein
MPTPFSFRLCGHSVEEHRRIFARRTDGSNPVPSSGESGVTFFRLQHVYGAGILFALAVALLGGSLFRFSQEVRIGLSEVDHYR